MKIKKVILWFFLLGTTGKYFQTPNSGVNSLTGMGTFHAVSDFYVDKRPMPLPKDEDFIKTLAYWAALVAAGLVFGIMPMPQDGKLDDSFELAKLD